MSVKDEFHSLPPEERALPKEAADRRDEENQHTANKPAKPSGIDKREKQKRNSLIKMIVGALVSVTVITGVAGEDIFYRTNSQEGPASGYVEEYDSDNENFDEDFGGNRIEEESLSVNKEESESVEDTNSEEDIVNDDTGLESSIENVDEQSSESDSDEESTEESTEGSQELVEKDCPTCNGTGIICPGSIAADDPEGCHGAVIVDCKACNGTGYQANGKLCNWCKGTLKHMCPSFESHYDCPDCDGTGRITEYADEQDT